MTDVTYDIVEHDGGWAYKVDGVFSETFRTHQDAHDAAAIAAQEQQRGGDDEVIEYQDKDGRWKVETAEGGDRPTSHVED